MDEYDKLRQTYRPAEIKVLMIAESPPPAANIQSSRHFYRSETQRKDDRLFTNTIQTLYPQAADLDETELESHKEEWLSRFQSDGWYIIEALGQSQPHEVTKKQRQQKIKDELPSLLQKIADLSNPQTKIILVKSNVFEAAATPLRQAGYRVLNTALLDYPGRYNQSAYRKKLNALAGLV